MSFTLKKIFTNKKISKFFHFALLINVTGLLSDIIVYRYFPQYEFMKTTNENLSNLSILMVCCVLISQGIMIFIKNHQKFVARHKILALTFIVCMSTFAFWFLHADNDIQENFIIFFSSVSRNNHDISVLLIVAGLFCMLIFNFFKLLRETETIDETSVPQHLTSTFYLLLQEYALIFIALCGVFHLNHFRKFARKILGHSQSTLLTSLNSLEIILPLTWTIALAYYFYKLNKKRKKTQNHTPNP